MNIDNLAFNVKFIASNNENKQELMSQIILGPHLRPSHQRIVLHPLLLIHQTSVLHPLLRSYQRSIHHP